MRIHPKDKNGRTFTYFSSPVAEFTTPRQETLYMDNVKYNTLSTCLQYPFAGFLKKISRIQANRPKPWCYFRAILLFTAKLQANPPQTIKKPQLRSIHFVAFLTLFILVLHILNTTTRSFSPFSARKITPKTPFSTRSCELNVAFFPLSTKYVNPIISGTFT